MGSFWKYKHVLDTGFICSLCLEQIKAYEWYFNHVKFGYVHSDCIFGTEYTEEKVKEKKNGDQN